MEFESEEQKEYYENLSIIFGTELTAKEFWQMCHSDDDYEEYKEWI